MTFETKERQKAAIRRYVEEKTTEEMAKAILAEAENLKYFGCRGSDEIYKTKKMIVKIREREERCREIVFFDTEIHFV